MLKWGDEQVYFYGLKMFEALKSKKNDKGRNWYGWWRIYGVFNVNAEKWMQVQKNDDLVMLWRIKQVYFEGLLMYEAMEWKEMC